MAAIDAHKENRQIKAMNTSNSDLFAAIDLGSNSFHMLVVRQVAGTIQTVAKIKRKVRLAAGLDDQLQLSEEAINRGLHCLRLFAERLRFIPQTNVRIVATATLRLAKNSPDFVTQAEAITGHHVEIISGEQEAHFVYQGAAFTSDGSDQRLVIDIGGASTELIIGRGIDIQQAVSLNMGCVRFTEAFFADGKFTQERFANAIAEAQAVVSPLLDNYTEFGWQQALGASGTLRAIQEVLLANGHDDVINLERLQALQQQIIAAGSLEQLDIVGLANERKPVFAGGLAILTGLFQALNIEQLQIAGGALREGLVYGMLNVQAGDNVRQRTLKNLAQKYHLDRQHGRQCRQIALALCKHFEASWSITDDGKAMLACAAQLHEIGFTIGFVNGHQHGAYILNHTNQPGFSSSQQALLATLIGHSKGKLDLAQLKPLQGYSNEQVIALIRILRWAIILTSHRANLVVMPQQLNCSGLAVSWKMPKGWRLQHPLSAADLTEERHYQANAGLSFTFAEH
ncbi:guanosine-5'-triphosphate,3'-diphosphate pyrophosphatase [Neiella marina]|uniref:Guanosine-5'-triphosphate,3'-diphosphate pyrophosphatase n=1 Tax=Neiella holothuriorum TaxID=2870530 RepID=A0ABS7EDP4_9GAMM|nr:guanosine-5'-triphosphate,3'-diphosphate pyrophosphatase [Neiella holothuriorum]MBW8189941.1 guanosine-5'-triphosphate,3'-diphosphate pyrophosphatase [Neiella holothuriorum]